MLAFVCHRESFARRRVAHSVANRDELTMNVKQRLDLFTQVFHGPGRATPTL
jgi:hypothetical protein